MNTRATYSQKVHCWPHHERTFSIYLCPLSFWLTLPRGVLSTSWCCPFRPCVVFLACVHLALFLALSLSPGNSLISSRFVNNPLICFLCCLWNPQNFPGTRRNIKLWRHVNTIYHHFICSKPKMQQCKLKPWTLNKTHQAQTSSYGGLWKNTVTHKYTKYSNCTKHKNTYNTSNLETLKKSRKIDLVDWAFKTGDGTKINSVWEKVHAFTIRSLKKFAHVRERWGFLSNLY